MALLSSQATVSITDYGPVTAAPTAGTAIPICALLRSFSENASSQEVDQTALCDTIKTTIPTYQETTIEMEAFIPATGFTFRSLLNHWVRVVVDLDGAGSLTAITDDGAVIAVGFALSVGDSQTEKITIRKRAAFS